MSKPKKLFHHKFGNYWHLDRIYMEGKEKI